MESSSISSLIPFKWILEFVVFIKKEEEEEEEMDEEEDEEVEVEDEEVGLAVRQAAGYRALDAMESHLSGHEFLAGGDYSLADISLYAYTHVAHEGGFDLGRYPAIRGWLERVAAQPGHVAITAVS